MLKSWRVQKNIEMLGVAWRLLVNCVVFYICWGQNIVVPLDGLVALHYVVDIPSNLMKSWPMIYTVHVGRSNSLYSKIAYIHVHTHAHARLLLMLAILLVMLGCLLEFPLSLLH